MDPLISIPREALAGLLRAAGSPLTPEEYLASLAPAAEGFERYPSRARASVWSKSILMGATILSGLCVLVDFDVEGLIVTLGVAAVTWFEYRVSAYFYERNPKAPDLGFRNQSALAAGLLVYGLYHALTPYQISVPLEYLGMVPPETLALMRLIIRGGFLAVALVGGGGQFSLAWYYRSARVRTEPT